MIDVVMITNGKRPELFDQSRFSLIENCTNKDQINLVIVCDGFNGFNFRPARCINIRTDPAVGASAARNIGASSIPKYRRGKYVMFLDDDVYMCPGWDKQLLSYSLNNCIFSGHSHPYNHTKLYETDGFYTTNVLSTVHMLMPWYLWDNVGFFTEPGGSGGSEDVDYCNRARALMYALVVTKPHCVIHTGLHGSSGKKIVGYNEMCEQNYQLLEQWGLQRKVIFS